MCKTAIDIMRQHQSQTFSKILGTALLLKRQKKNQCLHRALGQWVLKPQVFFTKTLQIAWTGLFFFFLLLKTSVLSQFLCDYKNSFTVAYMALHDLVPYCLLSLMSYHFPYQTLLITFQPHCPPFRSLNMLRSFVSQGLCTYYFLCLK